MKFLRERKLPPASTWLLLFALIFGTSLALVGPPGQVPDEDQHFGRAYALSTGQLFPTTAILPDGILNLFSYTEHLKFQPANKIQAQELLSRLEQAGGEKGFSPRGIPGSSVYTPVPYLFSATGIGFARLVGFSFAGIYYAGRLANLLAWIVLVYTGLRRTPVFSWVFLLLLLAPMSLFQAASYSADCITNGLSFLWICLVLEMALDKKPLDLRRIIILLSFAILLPLTKPPYSALLLAALVIPASRFQSRKQHRIILLAMLLLAVPIFFVSSGINREFYFAHVTLMPGVNPAMQLAGLLTHPDTFLLATFRTLLVQGRPLFAGYLGILGWLDTLLPYYFYYSYTVVLLLAALLDSKPEIRIELWQKIIFVSTGLFASLLVAAGQWITWTPLNAGKLVGIQGRYFIPAGPLILLAFYNWKFGKYQNLLALFTPVYSLVILLTTLITIVQRYYYPI